MLNRHEMKYRGALLTALLLSAVMHFDLFVLQHQPLEYDFTKRLYKRRAEEAATEAGCVARLVSRYHQLEAVNTMCGPGEAAECAR